VPDLTLTFDNGPEPTVTPGVLDLLAARDIRTTFFVIGRKAATPEGQALCARAQAEGHWIGNHSWTHETPLGQLTEAGAAAAEITRTQDAIAAFAHPSKLFRPFGGGGHLDQRLLNAEAVETLRRGAYSCVLWNAVPRDFADPDGWVETALTQMEGQPWTLMVLHDLPNGAAVHLPRFLDAVRDRGFRLRQDFTPTCMPIRAGVVAGALDGIVTADSAAG